MSGNFSFLVILTTGKKTGWSRILHFHLAGYVSPICQTVLSRNVLEMDVVILVLKSLSDKYLLFVVCTLDSFIFVTYVNVK